MATQTPQGTDRSDHSHATTNVETEAADGLKASTKEKIDKTLAELNVSTTDSGQDQSQEEDTEGSNSSSKNLDKQGK